MNYMKGILHNIINKNYNFCCLCFKTINNEPYHFGDQVSLKNINVQIGEMLSYLFGQEIFIKLSAFDAVCEECVTMASYSYKFIKGAKENTQYLFSTIEHLADCFENIPEDVNDMKTLFVTLNPNLCTMNQYYDNVGIVSTKQKAWKRFQSIIELENEKSGNQKELISQKKTITKINKNILLSKNEDGKICRECLKIFPTQANLKNHYMRIHASKPFKCQNCPKTFVTEALLSAHTTYNHVDLVCSECGKSFQSRASFNMHERGHKLKLMVCPDCGRVYKNRNTFRKHLQNNICQSQMRNSPANAKFTCDYCQKRYSQKITLRVHIQYEHLGYKYLQCKWCDKKFYCKSRLNAHAVKHTKERNFPCTLCDGKFVTKESLLYHTRTHTGERPYQCPHCDSRFLSASRRQNHVKTYHTDPTVECDICHSKFRSHIYLLKHKKNHMTDTQNMEQNSNSQNSVESSNSKKLKEVHLVSKHKEALPLNKINLEQNSVIQTHVETASNVKIYYEIDREGKFRQHSNPDRQQIITVGPEIKVETHSDMGTVQYVYQTNEADRDIQTGDEKLYLEVLEEDESSYVLQISENVEV